MLNILQLFAYSTDIVICSPLEVKVEEADKMVFDYICISVFIPKRLAPFASPNLPPSCKLVYCALDGTNDVAEFVSQDSV